MWNWRFPMLLYRYIIHWSIHLRCFTKELIYFLGIISKSRYYLAVRHIFLLLLSSLCLISSILLYIIFFLYILSACLTLPVSNTTNTAVDRLVEGHLVLFHVYYWGFGVYEEGWSLYHGGRMDIESGEDWLVLPMGFPDALASFLVTSLYLLKGIQQVRMNMAFTSFTIILCYV